MFEFRNTIGYVMWSIRGKVVERQCILYDEHGEELDKLDIHDAEFILKIVEFSRNVYVALKDVGPVERSIYLENLPSLLELGKCYTSVLTIP